jgi:hypothetical protein
MKKSLVFTTVLLIVLVSAIFYFKKNESSSTLNPYETEFAVRDTAAIDKIFLADRAGNKTTLLRNEDHSWRTSEGVPVNQGRVETLLQTIKNVEVKAPVPLNARNNVLKDMASRALKIEIYQNDKLVKTYYVGSETHDKLGTFMMLENAQDPYITHIPGFNGFLNIRYFAESREWHTKNIFPYRVRNIKQVKVNYRDDAESSFKLLVDENDGFSIVYLDDADKKIENPDQRSVIRFLRNYSNFQFEGRITYKAPKQVDSFYHAEPYAVLEVTNLQGESSSIYLHPKPADRRTKTLDDEGKQFPVDKDKSIGFINNQKNRLVLLQHYTLDRLLKKPEDFLSEEILSAK